MNGVDAVLLASGNDCRATAAAVHSYSARSGTYQSLSTIQLTETMFRYEMSLPLSVGTAGGITRIHPIVKKALALMKNPDARQLMMIAAASGMANNFSALASLVTTGIQRGHMRMHLSNILHHLEANLQEWDKTLNHFGNKTVTYSTVEAYIKEIRKVQ
jgi:hydroxymethylglutaryl-CoA reductase